MIEQSYANHSTNKPEQAVYGASHRVGEVLPSLVLRQHAPPSFLRPDWMIPLRRRSSTALVRGFPASENLKKLVHELRLFDPAVPVGVYSFKQFVDFALVVMHERVLAEEGQFPLVQVPLASRVEAVEYMLYLQSVHLRSFCVGQV